MDFRVVQGDIAQQEADVLVNAAGTSLQMGSGVAGALRRGAGEELNDEAMSKGPIELGAESLVVPALGCGVAGFDLAEGARIIAEEIAAYDPEPLSDVRIIAYSDDEYETIADVAAGT
jgi:O-acetyl-ADP-ribose deacetylase (regulator of RNase III)